MSRKLYQADLPTLRTLLTTLGDIVYASAANTPARRGIGSSGQQLTVVDGLPIWSTPGIPILCNSSMDWWRRIETAAQTNTTTFDAITSFAADRFYTLPVGASVTTQQSALVPDMRTRFAALITGATSVTTVDYGQRIRNSYVPLYSQSLVFSAYVFNNTGADFTPNLRVDTPASGNVWTTPTNRLNQALQLCPNNAWTRVYHIFDPSAYTNVTLGMSVALRIPSGSLDGAGKSVRIAQMDLRPGNVLLPFRGTDADIESLRCLHYYRKSYHDGVALATDTLVGLVGMGLAGSGATNVNIVVPFGLNMWKSPTVRLWGKTGTPNQFYKSFAATNHDAVVAGQTSPGGFFANNNTTTTEDMFFHYDAVAELT